MNQILGTIRAGQIVPDAPVTWPEGSRVSVQLIVGMSEEEQSNDPQSIADWLARMDQLEPLEMTPEEEADLAAWRQKIKEYTIANMNKHIDEWIE